MPGTITGPETPPFSRERARVEAELAAALLRAVTLEARLLEDREDVARVIHFRAVRSDAFARCAPTTSPRRLRCDARRMRPGRRLSTYTLAHKPRYRQYPEPESHAEP